MAEGHFVDVREIAAKCWGHYAIDITTPWHVTRELSSEMHSKGETELWGLWVHGKIVPPLPTGILPDAKSLFHSAQLAAENTNRLFLDKLIVEQSKGRISVELGRAIVINSFCFGAAVARHIWDVIR